jgi:hypothetical protein
MKIEGELAEMQTVSTGVLTLTLSRFTDYKVNITVTRETIGGVPYVMLEAGPVKMLIDWESAGALADQTNAILAQGMNTHSLGKAEG